MSTGASAAAAKDSEFSVRSLLMRHKLFALGLAAAVALMLAMILVAVLGPKGGAVTDSTTCTQWGSANQALQAAYGRLYLKEHGPLPGGGSSPSKVIAAINNGCTQAYGDDVSDTATVRQAISGGF
ncbi:MAG TPA: hypothetical protein VFB39_06245 [Solirubrobacteraceae bacterium]|nr:hypothetical protein [Solirubrobacteraceae bacterium]